MKKIAEETIKNSLEKLNKMPAEESEKLMKAFSEEQPFILGYVFLMNEKLSSDQQLEMLLYLQIAIWMSFKEVFGEVPEISEEVLIEVAEKHLKEVEAIGKIDSENEDKIAELSKIQFSTKNQQLLLTFISTFIYTEMFQNDDLRAQGTCLSVSQIAVNAYDKVLNV